ncbi:long-chain fatty acid--CoA ligase [Haladaptatus sp. QDMS2]|uniref:AMP-dependent synthetase/ligase n=1 Tax=Haladaptatus sp. QDMS2 TaxID=3033391 RepID=UPI0023E786C9|nr:long-chain fatty acid--CoA ligase [Haladaptatus sp. QDMS2]
MSEIESRSTGHRTNAHQTPTYRRLWARRPLFGSSLLLIAGALIAIAPFELPRYANMPGAFTSAGLLFAFLVVLCGAAAYVQPSLSTFFGVGGILFSIASLMGAFSVYSIGTVFGVVGGVLCAVWEPAVESEGEAVTSGEAVGKNMTAADCRTAETDYSDEVIADDTIPRMFEASANRNARRDAQMYKAGIYDRSLVPDVVKEPTDGQFGCISYAKMQDIVHNFAAGFRELGVEDGMRVGMFANTRMEWAQCDFALLAAGGVVTTVYTESSPTQVEYLLSDPGARGVVVENETLLERVLEVEDNLDLEFIVVMDELSEAYGGDNAFTLSDDENGDVAASDGIRDDIYTLAEVHELGASAFDEDAYEQWLVDRSLSDLASLIYTSGTTGRPKGVRLTHANFRANVNQIRRRFAPRPDRDPDVPSLDADATTLSFLPLAHVFERTAGHFVMFASGGTVAYAESADTVSEDIVRVRPTTATSVPRVYERIFDSMREQASESDVKERIFNWAVGVGREYYRVADPGPVLKAKYFVANQLVFSQVKEQMGGNIEFFISGGGSLSKELAELFQGMDLTILEGYGLTETAPVLTVNPPEDPRPGTLGVPLVDVETKFDETVVSDDQREKASGPIGELLVKGPNLTEGYWMNSEATANAFTKDGWFRTGDIVEEADDGYLVYHDRLKQLLVLSTGKNVAPGPIEDAFATSPRVEQIMVLGDDEKFVSALIVPNFENLRDWADREGIDLPADEAAMCDDPRVEQWIRAEVTEKNKQFSKSEKIKKFELVPVEWTPENDLLTPSMKMKRRNILSRFDDAVDSIYGEAEAEKAATSS